MQRLFLTCDGAHKGRTIRTGVLYGIIPFRHPVNRTRKGMGMSGTRQGVHRVKARSFACTKVKHSDLSAARQHIEELKNKNVRGSARLKVIRCTQCSKKAKADVFHVGHNNGKKGPQK